MLFDLRFSLINPPQSQASLALYLEWTPPGHSIADEICQSSSEGFLSWRSHARRVYTVNLEVGSAWSNAFCRLCRGDPFNRSDCTVKLEFNTSQDYFHLMLS